MTDDRYAPPAAEVADPSAARPPLPRAVRRACRLIVASMLLGLVTLLPGIAPSPPDATPVPLAFTLGVVVVFSGLTVWLAVEIVRGKGWARWVMLAYLALGWWLGWLQFTDDFLRSPVAGAIEMICVFMEIGACMMLFFGSGARWFAELATLRRAPGTGA